MTTFTYLRYLIICFVLVFSSFVSYAKASLLFKRQKNSSWPATGLGNKGPLKILNGTKLILDDPLLVSRALKYTAIPYRASTGPEQGFPCEVFLTGKNLFSLQGTTILIAGTLFSLQGFPCEKNFTEKTLFSLQGMGVQCRIVWTKTLRPISQS